MIQNCPNKQVILLYLENACAYKNQLVPNILPPSQKKLFILRFKFFPKKQVTLPYLESVFACKNQLLLNIANK